MGVASISVKSEADKQDFRLSKLDISKQW